MNTSLSRILITTLFVFIYSSPHASDITVEGQFISNATPGTPPLVTSSQTQVNNLNSEFLGGYNADSLRLHEFLTVGKNGTGEFATIQAAIDSRGGIFAVLVGPGIYEEQVKMKPGVQLMGSGIGVTRITHTGSNTNDDSAATVILGFSNPKYQYALSDLSIYSDPGDTANMYTTVVYFKPTDDSNVANIERVFIFIKSVGTGIGVWTKAPMTIRDSEIRFLNTYKPGYIYGIWNEHELRLERVRIWALLEEGGYAIYNHGVHTPAIISTVTTSHITGNIGSNVIGAYITTVLHSERGIGVFDGDVSCYGLLIGTTYKPSSCS